jgi:hypothetical protein
MGEYLYIILFFSIKNEVNEMSDEERKELCQKLVREYPYMILEILKPATRHPGGYHPGPGQASPDWCVCRHCREMPTQVERQCCGKENCVTLLPVFIYYFLSTSYQCIN